MEILRYFFRRSIGSVAVPQPSSSHDVIVDDGEKSTSVDDSEESSDDHSDITNGDSDSNEEGGGNNVNDSKWESWGFGFKSLEEVRKHIDDHLERRGFCAGNIRSSRSDAFGHCYVILQCSMGGRKRDSAREKAGEMPLRGKTSTMKCGCPYHIMLSRSTSYNDGKIEHWGSYREGDEPHDHPPAMENSVYPYYRRRNLKENVDRILECLKANMSCSDISYALSKDNITVLSTDISNLKQKLRVTGRGDDDDDGPTDVEGGRKRTSIAAEQRDGVGTKKARPVSQYVQA